MKFNKEKGSHAPGEEQPHALVLTSIVLTRDGLSPLSVLKESENDLLSPHHDIL